MVFSLALKDDSVEQCLRSCGSELDSNVQYRLRTNTNGLLVSN